MKKLSAFFIAACLIIGLFPAAAASEVGNLTVRYDLSSVMKAQGMNTLTQDKMISEIDYGGTNGFFDIIPRGVGDSKPDNNWVYYQNSTDGNYTDQNVVMRRGRYLTFEINVPVSGTYKMVAHHGIAQNGGDMDVYVLNGAYDDATFAYDAGTYLGRYNCDGINMGFARMESSNVKTVESGAMTETDAEIYLEAGKHLVTFSRVGMTDDANGYRASAGGFSLVSGDGSNSALMNGSISGGGSVSVGEKVIVSANGYDSKTAEKINGFVYSSSNKSVAEVDSATGEVTGISEGAATIKAVCGAIGELETKVVVKRPSYDISDSVSLAYSVNGTVSKVENKKRGTIVTVNAPETEGMTFRHWLRGTEENGKWVSSDGEYSFALNTNTYLTAVYTKNKTGKFVEFFNQNGEFLSEAEADGNTAALPSAPELTGYKFDKWLISEDKEFTAETILESAITRVVARFKDAEKSYIVNGNAYKYGEKAEFSNPSEVTWLRSGTAVAYGKNYTYFVWDDAEITYTEEGTAEPTIILDKTVKDNYAYMIEYDAGDKEIVEAGIIFGADKNITIDSCKSKATSENTGLGIKHGQFTAKPYNGTDTAARGYLIYKDGESLKAIYSK